jgi:hypothetical protein
VQLLKHIWGVSIYSPTIQYTCCACAPSVVLVPSCKMGPVVGYLGTCTTPPCVLIRGVNAQQCAVVLIPFPWRRLAQKGTHRTYTPWHCGHRNSMKAARVTLENCPRCASNIARRQGSIFLTARYSMARHSSPNTALSAALGPCAQCLGRNDNDRQRLLRLNALLARPTKAQPEQRTRCVCLEKQRRVVPGLLGAGLRRH